ncbi:hypothetical protein L1987_22992 [Smallanthus sonchifolius]|uniref:Uncharacterized protein n=1 Tax=Smallanthus sonchifolius TaxID=185202 RepID=A0ACB9IHV2_9ASTR|nr:hypothetical protein L1987_22992 [Smallanthus sonchifolius]
MALLCKKSKSVSCYPSGLRTDDELKTLFQEWAIKQGKFYNTLEEKEGRLQIFRFRLRRIEQHNFTGDPLWRSGLNKFSETAEGTLSVKRMKKSLETFLSEILMKKKKKLMTMMI